MEVSISESTEIHLILEYITKKTSWKNSYFSKFSIGQKIIFFVPIPFLFFPIYGTYALFYEGSWFAFSSCGIVMLVSIWIFFKQKSRFEKDIFEKFYKSEKNKTISDLHITEISTLLGDQNTSENRDLWKIYFKRKNNSKLPLFIMFISLFFY